MEDILCEPIELIDDDLDVVSGGTGGSAAAAAGNTTASAAAGQGLGVTFLIVDGLIITVRGEVFAGAGTVLGPANNGAAATAS